MMPEKKESYSRDALGARMSKKLCLNLVNNVEEWLNKSKKKKKNWQNFRGFWKHSLTAASQNRATIILIPTTWKAGGNWTHTTLAQLSEKTKERNTLCVCIQDINYWFTPELVETGFCSFGWTLSTWWILSFGRKIWWDKKEYFAGKVGVINNEKSPALPVQPCSCNKDN